MKQLLTLIFMLLVIGQLTAQVDHSDFFDGKFDTPQEVTETCLDCHDGVGKEIMHTRHWNWMAPEGSKSTLGKKNLMNNFCIATPSNLPRCTSCHIGYGWKDGSFDFTNEKNIDCLVCHDQSGTYKKIPTGAGAVDKKVDLLTVAQSVGLTTRANCGTCHFDGGGGTGVKHGDMDGSILKPTREIDVHMGGEEFQCTECHVTTEHKITGGSHGSMEAGENMVSCLDCHDEEVHAKGILNKHIASVACETCHIPAFAREMPTKVWWDWSEAGKDKKDKKDKYGESTYNKKKGSFVWEKNVIPTYAWYNGSAKYYHIGDKIDPNNIVELNKLNGSIKDKNAKIAPFKVMKGKQPYDKVNNYMIVPHLFGKEGYWKTFDWKEASEIGMESVNLVFSGSVGFIETEMSWPINHMVVPAENALKCMACHGKNSEHRLDWKALGYSGDPLRAGGRVKNKLVQ
ncbi:MAG: tetrathionate reductase family octaheme c-type cytochrome [Bacteroidota bacterium]